MLKGITRLVMNRKFHKANANYKSERTVGERTDPLRVTGEAYAKRLEKAGKLLDLKCYEKGYHGFGTL